MVYVVNYEKMTPAERALAIGLQGVVNRKGKRVLIDADKYIDYVTDSNRRYVDVYELTDKFAGEFSGIVVYTLDSHDAGINMAAMLAAVDDVLGVPDVLLDKVAKYHLPVACDLRQICGSNAERQRVVFDRCYDRLNKNGLVHQVVNGDNFHIRLRDLSIANRWACVYTGEGDEDRAFREYVLGKLDSNIPVYGWNDDEIAFIKDISEFGDYALPSDWSMNHSYFEASDATLTQRIHGDLSTVAPDKHYVALVVSDGDNIQWLERDFSLPGGNFGQRLATDCNYKMTWTFSPSMAKICPDGARHIFASAKRDYFVSGVSGVGCLNELTNKELAENLKMLIAAYEKQECPEDVGKYKESLAYLEKVWKKRSKISEEKQKQEIQCLIRGYGLLDDEDSVEKVLELVKRGMQTDYLNDPNASLLRN